MGHCLNRAGDPKKCFGHFEHLPTYNFSIFFCPFVAQCFKTFYDHNLPMFKISQSHFYPSLMLTLRPVAYPRVGHLKGASLGQVLSLPANEKYSSLLQTFVNCGHNFYSIGPWTFPLLLLRLQQIIFFLRVQINTGCKGFHDPGKGRLTEREASVQLTSQYQLVQISCFWY